MDHKKRVRLALALFVFLLIIAAAALGILPQSVPDATPGSTSEVVVTRVIDGDTLEAGGKTIRLLGVDAPERDRCFYAEAKEELTRLTLGQSVRMEGDPLSDNVDEYGRLLRYVHLADSASVNARLIEGGFARHLSWFPNSENVRFAELESAARAAQLGLWSACAR